MAGVVVSGLRLPGVGWRYDLEVAGGSRLVVVVEDGGRRHLMVIRPGDTDPLESVSMTGEQSLAVAALLTGARFAVADAGGVPDLPAAEASGDVVVASVLVDERSAAVGATAADLDERLGADAALLAVICDETPEIVEDEPTRPTRPGDRLVVAARRGRVDDALALLGR